MSSFKRVASAIHRQVWLKGWILAAGIILVVLIFYFEENIRHLAAWNRYKHAAGLDSKPLNWRAFLPPRVPERENFASTPVLKAVAVKGQTPPSLAADLARLPVGTHTADLFRGTSTDLSGFTGESNSLRAAAEATLLRLKPLEPTLAELRTASELPYAQFHADGDNPWNVTIPDFVALRTLSQILSVRCGAYLELGDSAEALKDVRVIVRLADALKHNNTLVCAMIRVQLTGLALGSFQEGCLQSKWSPQEIVQLQSVFEKINLLSTFSNSMEGGERAGIHHVVENYSTEELTSLFGDHNSYPTFPERVSSSLKSLAIELAPRGWRYRSLMIYDQPMVKLLNAVDAEGQRIRPAQVDEALQDLLSNIERGGPFIYLSAIATPNFMKATLTTAYHQTMLNLSQVICALERYKIDKGSYPEFLLSLTPKYITKLPHDLVTGTALTYRLGSPDQFTLYSTGWDAINHGGVPGNSPGQGDWVWSASNRPKSFASN